MSGWFAVKRGITSHPVFKGDMAKVGFFLWMMESAAFKAVQIDIGGKPYTVPRGSLCYSQRFMAEKAQMSVKALRGFLKALEGHGIIEMKVVQTGHARETKRTQLTLCNYEKYQAAGNNKETTGKQHGNKEEQGNKGTSIPVGADKPAEASSTVEVSVSSSAVWNAGKPFLASRGVSDPGSIIGRWMKTHQPLAILAAIEAAQKAGTQDPIPYITEALKGGNNEPSKRANAERERLNAFIAGARATS